MDPDLIMTLFDDLRAEARRAPESGIVAVANYGRGREGLIPLWAGESDLPTPSFIADAAARSLAAGETFYTPFRFPSGSTTRTMAGPAMSASWKPR